MSWKRIVTASVQSTIDNTTYLLNVGPTDLLPAPANEAATDDVLKVNSSGYLDWAPDDNYEYEHPTNYTVFNIDNTGADANYCAKADGIPVAVADENECRCGTSNIWTAGTCDNANYTTEADCLANSGIWTTGSCNAGDTGNEWITAIKGPLDTDEVLNHLYYQLITDNKGHVTHAQFYAGKRKIHWRDFGYTGDYNANNYIHHTGFVADYSDAYAGEAGYQAYGTTSTDLNHTAAASGDRVIDTLNINLATTTEGHVASWSATATERQITLADLGYIGTYDADNYAKWVFKPYNTSSAAYVPFDILSSSATAVDNVSAKVIEFIGGTNMSILADDTTLGTLALTFVGTADALGQLEEVTIGNGIQGTTITCSDPQFDNATDCVNASGTWNSSGAGSEPTTYISGIRPSVEIKLALADDANSTLHAASNNAVTPTGHTHAITAVSDASAVSAYGKLLKTDTSGNLTLHNLEVQGSLVTSGAGGVILNSTNLAIQDSEIQINMASSATYADTNSAILFGGTSTVTGGKIINDISANAFVFSDFVTADISSPASGGSFSEGSLRDIICGNVTAADLTCTSITSGAGSFTGTVSADDLQLMDHDDTFDPINDGGADGQIHWDGINLYLYNI